MTADGNANAYHDILNKLYSNDSGETKYDKTKNNMMRTKLLRYKKSAYLDTLFFIIILYYLNTSFII